VTTPHPLVPPATRILIVDDHEIFREGVRMLLERDSQVAVIAEAADAQQALALAQSEQPDIILLDVDLAGFDALDLVELLQAAAPEARIILLTGMQGAELQARALRLGVRGFVQKEQSAELLLRAIRKVRGGELWFDRGTVATAMTRLLRGDPEEGAPTASFTRRELEIVRLIGEGMTNDEIAEQLDISEKTVRNYLTVVFEKAGVKDRLHLAIYSYRNGIARLPR